MKVKIILISIAVFLGISTSFTYHFTQQADINYFKGHRLFIKGQHEKAIPFYLSSLEKAPTKAETLKELAYCYLWTGKPDKAIGLFKDVTSKYPDNYKLKASLAEAYSWNKKYPQAIALFKEIIQNTDSPWAKEKLAEIYLWSGQPEKAKIILEELIKKYPYNEDLKLLWGKALYYTGESEKASRVLEGLLKKQD